MGDLVFDDRGLAKRGLLVRHLVTIFVKLFSSSLNKRPNKPPGKPFQPSLIFGQEPALEGSERLKDTLLGQGSAKLIKLRPGANVTKLFLT